MQFLVGEVLNRSAVLMFLVGEVLNRSAVLMWFLVGEVLNRTCNRAQNAVVS
jgi:hypothetical protein